MIASLTNTITLLPFLRITRCVHGCLLLGRIDQILLNESTIIVTLKNSQSEGRGQNLEPEIWRKCLNEVK